MSISYGGDNITFPDGSTQNTSPQTGFVNRIINGDMRIDQRNAGASVTPTDSQYLVDRWLGLQAVASKYSAQQNAGSVTPPAGFSNYLGATSLSSYSVGATDYFGLRQNIEGFNIVDLAWGTANAQPITFSFWVRSSLTGTFGGALQNAAATRYYAFSYPISAANTWEYKTVTIAGDTSGTWAKNNTIGLSLTFGLGVGSTYSIAAGSWGSTGALSATGATSVVGTSGATFYITGVSLVKGSTALPWEFRSYGQELALCERYFEAGSSDCAGAYISAAGVSIYGAIGFSTKKRATPTMSAPANWTTQASSGGDTSRTFGTGTIYTSGFSAQLAGSDPRGKGSWQASAEL